MNRPTLRRISTALLFTLASTSGAAFAGSQLAIIEEVDLAKSEISVLDIAGNMKTYRFDQSTVFTSAQNDAVSANRLIPSETVTIDVTNQNTLTRVSVDTHYTNHGDVLRERRLSAVNKKGVLVSSN